MIKNYGISFGWTMPGILLVTGCLLVGLIWLAVRYRDWRLGLMAIGGSLNFCERLVKGYVSDYWKIPMLPVYNNVSDWLIFVGGALYLWKLFSKTKS